MKKYKFLEAGDVVAIGDEYLSAGWNEVSDNDLNLMGYTVGDEDAISESFRRPIPHVGQTRFLMTISVAIPVQFDCTALTNDEIDAIAAETAVRTLMGATERYLSSPLEVVDWRESRIDDEEFQPVSEAKNPGKYRYLEEGEDVQVGDEMESSEGSDIYRPLMSTPYPVAVSKYQAEKKWFRRPITEPRYRPFKEGDLIEEGDQFRFNESCEWEYMSGPFPRASFAHDPCLRKLIK